MEIRIAVSVGERISVTVSDTGSGMKTETAAAINAQWQGAPSEALPAFGIGLSYVIRSLHEFFSEDCFFEVQSEEQKGTTFLIEMPKQKGAGYYAENSDH